MQLNSGLYTCTWYYFLKINLETHCKQKQILGQKEQLDAPVCIPLFMTSSVFSMITPAISPKASFCLKEILGSGQTVGDRRTAMHGQGNGPSSPASCLYSPCGPTAGAQGKARQQGKHPSAPALIMLPATCRLWLWDLLDQAQHKLTQVKWYRTTSGNHPGLKMPFIFLTAKHFLQKKYVTFLQALQFFLFFFFFFF